MKLKHLGSVGNVVPWTACLQGAPGRKPAPAQTSVSEIFLQHLRRTSLLQNSVKWAVTKKCFWLNIAKPFREKAEGMAVQPRNCSSPPEICPDLRGKHSHLVIFFAHRSLYPSSGSHLHFCWKNVWKNIKALQNNYKRLQEAKNMQHWQCVLHSYCLCAWGCELVISHASIKLRSPASLSIIQIILAMKYYIHLSALFAVQWEISTSWGRLWWP